MRVNYTIVFVSDMARSVEFYRDVLGIPLKFESSAWTEFSTDGATLALHLADGRQERSRSVGHSAPGQCRPGLSVPDLLTFHDIMVRKNVPCIQEPATRFGATIAQYADPDGLVISVSQQERLPE